ncbi:sulfite oxidase heme-binding subunit YedZ [Roseiterribacter gracilis]|uniref:Protein-methionine-sulfoxide reductase heme-binding subunit MsrQ n=1 Tax=Roseiterribacter gracilis TaxID=2812848 RepID=A0A8S8XB73_9PROT|nr:protein-methionine-sulfoxide reductase heme-binding subunit MsrQ [Rhodospirillales bacterium TMPK1]
MTKRIRDRVIYAVVWLACAAPLLFLVYWGLNDQLGANPITTGLRFLGLWGLRFLVAGLAITPLRGWFGWNFLQRYRRTIGLWGFAYVALHLLTYIGVDQFFDWNTILKDVLKRPYITFGMLGFVLLIPLAVTSTNAMVRRLGGRRWRQLHKLAYVIAPLGVLHYDLLVKADTTWPWMYAAILAVLLGWRVWQVRTRRAATRPVSA